MRIERTSEACKFFLLLEAVSHVSRSVYGHIDFLGRGATTLLEDVSYFFSNDEEQKALIFNSRILLNASKEICLISIFSSSLTYG
jgi:hypothetical protein